MKSALLTIFMLSLFLNMFAQENDSTSTESFFKGAIYPVMKSHPYMGVLPFASKELAFPKGKPVKIVIDLVADPSDSAQAHYAITDIGRTFNLHVANGADPKKLDIRVVVHASSHIMFYNNEKYNSIYGIDNPNIEVIKELASHSVKFYVCYQSLTFRGGSPADIIPELIPVLSAKTSLTYFQSLGYSLLSID